METENYSMEKTNLPEMYRIRFSCGEVSEMYNKARISEFIRRLREGGQEEDIRIGYVSI